MSNKDINRDEDFDKILRDKLSNYQLPVDNDGWNAISNSLKTKKIYILIRRTLSAVAAITLLLIIVLNYRTNKQSLELSKIELNNTERQLTFNEQDSATTNVTIPNLGKTQIALIEVKKDNTSLANAVIIAKDDTKNKIDSITHSSNSEDIINIAQNEQPQHETIDTTQSDDSNILPEKQHNDMLYTKNEIPLLDKSKKSKNSWAVLASLSSFGGSNNTKVGNNPAGIALLNSDNNSDFNPSEFLRKSITDVDYDIPLSFSLMAGKKINSFLSIETGLSYTRLNTKFKEKGNISTSELELHYIGIPINVTIDVWNITPRFKLYAGGGFMVEKGITSKYKLLYNESGQSTVTKENISGLQWSLNASVGISYRLVGNFNLYAEPKLYYYFDNNQPLSIRTEKRTVIGFNSGIKFDF